MPGPWIIFLRRDEEVFILAFTHLFIYLTDEHITLWESVPVCLPACLPPIPEADPAPC